MNFFDYFPEFLDYINAKGHSVETIRGYNYDARAFKKYLKESGIPSTLSSIDHKIIRRFIIWMKKQNYSSATMKRKLDTLGSFYNYLEKEDGLLLYVIVSVKKLLGHKNLCTTQIQTHSSPEKLSSAVEALL
ncbi:MAG: site-specific integrase [Eubacteriales bacterium]